MKLTNAEKLILMLLSDIHEKLKIDSDIDPIFIKDALQSGQDWSLAWKFEPLFSTEEIPQHVRDVGNYLTMWRMLEQAYKKLNAEDKDRVKKEVGFHDDGISFKGFDGNGEPEHLSAAEFMIEKLGRFQEFKGRDLNSHAPMLNGYERMYSAYETIRASSIDANLGADQIITILQAGKYRI